MTRKKSNAKKPAAAKPETSGDTQPAAGAEQEAPALVAGDGGGPAAGAEHQGQPGGKDAAADDLAARDAEVQGGDRQGSLVQDQQPAPNIGAIGDAGGDGDDGPQLDPDGKPAGDDAPAVTSRWHELYHGDPNFWPAILAGEQVTRRALRIVDADPDKMLNDIALDHDTLTGQSFAIAADLLREIGHARANVDVVASQLAIKGQRSDKTITGVERVVLECFLFTLASLDGFAKSEADRLAAEKAEAERKDPPKVPIEDTTLEPVDGPMDTWRV